METPLKTDSINQIIFRAARCRDLFKHSFYKRIIHIYNSDRETIFLLFIMAIQKQASHYRRNKEIEKRENQTKCRTRCYDLLILINILLILKIRKKKEKNRNNIYFSRKPICLFCSTKGLNKSKYLKRGK